MRGRLRVGWLLLALFALQAGASAAASAAASDCCPAMASAAPEAPAPCRTLSSIGCCEERNGVATREVFAPPSHAFVAVCAAPAACAAPRTSCPAALVAEGAARALRSTILRL